MTYRSSRLDTDDSAVKNAHGVLMTAARCVALYTEVARLADHNLPRDMVNAIDWLDRSIKAYDTALVDRADVLLTTARTAAAERKAGAVC